MGVCGACTQSTQVPFTQELLNNSAIPFAVVVSPMALPDPRDDRIPVSPPLPWFRRDDAVRLRPPATWRRAVAGRSRFRTERRAPPFNAEPAARVKARRGASSSAGSPRLFLCACARSGGGPGAAGPGAVRAVQGVHEPVRAVDRPGPPLHVQLLRAVQRHARLLLLPPGARRQAVSGMPQVSFRSSLNRVGGKGRGQVHDRQAMRRQAPFIRCAARRLWGGQEGRLGHGGQR